MHIENLQFSLSQNTVLHNGVDVAAVQAYVQNTNGMIAELQEMMHAQFQADSADSNRFEARIMEGCQSLCVHVH